jgi:hypothetical protein
MKATFPAVVFSLIFFLPDNCQAQTIQWQQQCDVQLKVSLNDKDHSLQGTENMHYFNNSPDTLYYIWMHCWPNAYRNDKTAFSEQLLANNRIDFYFSREEERGYMNQLQFSVDGIIATTEDHPVHQDILKLLLPSPLPPHQSLVISSVFHIKLPAIFSRMGYQKGFYAITQWYPKPAVYDKDGWHPMPYLDQGEFYSEFGNYAVAITVPDDFIVAGTGVLNDSIKGLTGISGEKLKTLNYTQENIHDFAWFASNKFIVRADTLVTPTGKTIELFSYQLPGHEQVWQKSVQYLKSAIRFRNSVIGEYPYTVARVVDGYQGEENGGMEYPTITVLNNIYAERELEMTIEHEIGHNWFYAALGSNERLYPWLDEGLDTYYDRRYEQQHPDYSEKMPAFLSHMLPFDPEPELLSGIESIHRDQAIATSADAFNAANYGLVPYYKAALWLEKLEQTLGRSLFDSCMKEYYREFSFHHPGPSDFQQVFETVSKQPIGIFNLLSKTGPMENPVPKKIKPVFLFDFRGNPHYQTIGIGPLPGYNFYDGFMLGGFLHNYQLPLPRFRFFIAPLYGTKSKSFAGLANLSYNWYPAGNLQQVEAGINLSRFAGNQLTYESEQQVLHYSKISPYLKFSMKERSPLSKRERFLQLKSFFFREESSDIQTSIVGTDTSTMLTKQALNRNLQELKFYYADHRALYPYAFDATINFMKDFTRLAFTGQYFFNYAEKNGGLDFRFFVGKFIYNGTKTASKQLALDRYHLNMTGANGYEDYTYSNYFVGRNEFSGWMSQQIMLRDGGFKVRTDLYSQEIGKTDNWLAAMNFITSIPRKFNPLSVLPVNIPLKIFLDIGTYAEAWDTDNEDGRLLFDSGIQLSLFSELVNIYIPVVNSTVFRNYNQSTLGNNKFLKTISFSIDIQKISSRKLLAKAGL